MRGLADSASGVESRGHRLYGCRSFGRALRLNLKGIVLYVPDSRSSARSPGSSRMVGVLGQLYSDGILSRTRDGLRFRVWVTVWTADNSASSETKDRLSKPLIV